MPPTNTPAILAITPNPALDITLPIEQLIPEATHRIDTALRKLGGKGVNVAAVAAEQGYTAYALGPVSEADLADLNNRTDGVVALPDGVHLAFTPTPVPLRATFAIYQNTTGETAIINERGGAHPDEVYHNMVTTLTSYLDQHPGSVVTVSGSFAPGAPADFVTRLVDITHHHGGKIIVDSAGAPLKAACAAGADLVKPNAAELKETTGSDSLIAGARQLLALGAGMVVASAGPDGLVAVTPDTIVAAKLDEVLKGNPTGAGDALVSALATGLIDGLEPKQLLQRGVAWSAAAVLQPAAGTIGEDYKPLLDRVEFPTPPTE
ncbi:1-phosphofructokinase family hexose kinase [Corynebacterium aquilae]|uniref:Carbohydrate kinase PfkB domain-containing protein n=1 Tax=Corynebacterium aquilae DSM 44791 TaxID=1431546 RepID=A0A1L7CIG7_9CORY|nr:PfkB family carbohydrate kinase [Corynebacterium aquilae]APT85608.1 hypothetical protein CAQU_11800 [Corynebacterium aquilae DSM 44791]